MTEPQAGFFDETSQHTYFLEYALSEQDNEQIKGVLTEILEASTKVYTQFNFGFTAWQRLCPEWQPEGLIPFTRIKGREEQVAPATQADILFRIHGLSKSDVFDQALWVHRQMTKIAKLTLEQFCFDYHHSLDLIGFEDGTANPKTDELKRSAALIPEGKPGAGGSLVLSQKWVHDLDKWEKVPVACQEKVVGRTKVTNEELEGEAMPDDSHVSRTDLKVNGVPMKIYRRSVPFGSVLENGLYFLAFACELIRFSSQLESMYGLADDQKIDQLLNYSKAVSGGYWFAPSYPDLLSVLQARS